MAKTTVKPAHDMQKGASIVDPTRSSKPAVPTYRYPLTKGLPTISPKSGTETGFGRNQYAGPSSVSVKDSADLSDFDISPKSGDAVLDSLKSGGFGDRSESGAPIDDLQRKINTDMAPPTYGMKVSPNRADEKVPSKTDSTSAQPPVRTPS